MPDLTVRIYKTRFFARWARKMRLDDAILVKSVSEIIDGLIDARLGGYLTKKRIPRACKGKRGGLRTILASDNDERWFFIFGFEKSQSDNIKPQELAALRKLAKDLLELPADKLDLAIREGKLLEIEYENKTS